MSNETNNLPAIAEIDFHGDLITCIEIEGTIRVAMKPISDKLGIDWPKTLRKIKRDLVLSEGMVEKSIPSPGGPQKTITLPLDYLNGVLFKIDAARYKVDNPRREVIIRYQRECYRVLYN